MSDRCDAQCIHGGKCRLIAGHKGWHKTRTCPELGPSMWPGDTGEEQQQ